MSEIVAFDGSNKKIYGNLPTLLNQTNILHCIAVKVALLFRCRITTHKTYIEGLVQLYTIRFHRFCTYLTNPSYLVSPMPCIDYPGNQEMKQFFKYSSTRVVESSTWILKNWLLI